MKKNGEHLREMWNITEHNNVHIIRLTRERREKVVEKLLEEIMTKTCSGYIDVRKKQTLKKLQEIETFQSDTRVNPSERYNNYKHIC